MPTFRKVEIVDARKFTGGGENGPELIFWVNSKEGKAIWVSDQTFNQGGRDPEHIRLYASPYSHMHEYAYVGDWIMQHQDGSFAVVRQQELDSEYEQV